jgi:hypothetical protein
LSEGKIETAKKYWNLQKQLTRSTLDDFEVVLSAGSMLPTALKLKDNRFINRMEKRVLENKLLVDFFFAEFALAHVEMGDLMSYRKYFKKAWEARTSLHGLSALPIAYVYHSEPDEFLKFLADVEIYGNPIEAFERSIEHYGVDNDDKLLKYIKDLKKYDQKKSGNEYEYLFLLGKNVQWNVSEDFLKNLKKIDKSYFFFFLSSFVFNTNCKNRLLFVIVIQSLMKRQKYSHLANFIYFSLFDDKFHGDYTSNARQLLNE